MTDRRMAEKRISVAGASESFDPDVVEPLHEGNPDLWKRLVGIYLKDTKDRLENLDQALKSGDYEAIHLTAHTLKTSSANLGAVKLSDLFRDLEALGEEVEPDRVCALVAQISREFEIVSDALAYEGDAIDMAERSMG